VERFDVDAAYREQCLGVVLLAPSIKSPETVTAVDDSLPVLLGHRAEDDDFLKRATVATWNARNPATTDIVTYSYKSIEPRERDAGMPDEFGDVVQKFVHSVSSCSS